MIRCTPAQHRVLKAIRALGSEHGYSPSYAEIARALGVSTQAVGKHIQLMCERGVLRKTYGLAHTIEIVGD